MRRYRAAIALVTEPEAPFSEGLKNALKEEFAHFDWLRENDLAKEPEPGEKKHVRLNPEAARQDHPAFREFEVELFRYLKEKNLSDKKSYEIGRAHV